MDLLMSRVPGSFDLVFVNGECPTTGDQVDRVIQRLVIRLRTFYQEWFLNYEYGVPYFNVLGKKVSKATVDIMLQEQIMSEIGVKEVLDFKSSLTNNTRIFSCSFRVKVTSGETSGLITI